MAVLGIDTSCYRTSLALTGDGALLADVRRLIEVPAGARGLRQSDALFQHVTHLGDLTERLFAEAGPVPLEAVCVSSRPRPVQGSYMPVFMAGVMAARAVAASHGVPLYETSHQQGHVRAAMEGAAVPARFLAVHLSGGTTEMLAADRALSIELIGASGDLHAGQLVDRIGVLMDLPFPAGPHLEELAAGGEAGHVIKTSVRGREISLSGAEAQAKRLLESGMPRACVAAEVYDFLARSLAKWIDAGAREAGLWDVLMSGGVSASAILRRALPERLKKLDCPVRLHWADPALSGDNAVGVALIGEAHYAREGAA